MAAIQQTDESSANAANDEEKKENTQEESLDIAPQVPSVELAHSNSNDKVLMPSIGFGLYQVHETEKVTVAALQVQR